MEWEDVRPAAPVPPLFVAGNLFHVCAGILKGFLHWRAHAQCAPAADRMPWGSSRPGRCCLSQPREGMTTSAFILGQFLVRAWVPGLRAQPGSSKRPVFGTCRVLVIMVFAAMSATTRLHLLSFRCSRLVCGPGARGFARTPLVRWAEGRRDTVARCSPGSRFSVCHAQTFQFASSPESETDVRMFVKLEACSRSQ